MKYLKMFFASLQMARTLDSKKFAPEPERVTALIDELCPDRETGRAVADRAHAGADAHPAPRAA